MGALLAARHRSETRSWITTSSRVRATAPCHSFWTSKQAASCRSRSSCLTATAARWAGTYHSGASLPLLAIVAEKRHTYRCLQVSCEARQEGANESFAYWLWGEQSSADYVQDSWRRPDGNHTKLYWGLQIKKCVQLLLRRSMSWEGTGRLQTRRLIFCVRHLRTVNSDTEFKTTRKVDALWTPRRSRRMTGTVSVQYLLYLLYCSLLHCRLRPPLISFAASLSIYCWAAAVRTSNPIYKHITRHTHTHTVTKISHRIV